MKIKVYYEDTDASGRVYHSNYLKYFERGRTDFLYRLGFNHKTLLERYELYFVVKTCDINFKKPAYFEDELVAWGSFSSNVFDRKIDLRIYK